MKKLYRGISWLLLLAMLVSMLSVGIYAEDDVTALVEEAVEVVEEAAPAPSKDEPVTEEVSPVVEVAPVAEEETSVVETAPVAEEETSVVETAPVAEEETLVVETAPVAEEGTSSVQDAAAVEVPELLVETDAVDVTGDDLQATTKRYYHIDVLTQGTYTYNFSYSGEFVSTADINITKVWDDAADNDSIRPASVQVNIYQNNSSAVYNTVTLTEDGGWKYSLNNVPAVDASGNKITYTAEEVNVPEGYTASVEIETISDDNASANLATYEKNGNTIIFGFGSKAPYVVVDGTGIAFSGNTAVVNGGTWTYDPATEKYSFIGEETMTVDRLNYITYTDYLGKTQTLSGTLYSSKWDSGHKNQEFFLDASVRQTLYLTPDSTIVVNYTYGYSYVDEFGHTHTYSNITTSQTFDDPENDNVCSKKDYSDSQAGYDVRLFNTHQTSDTFIQNEGTEYNVTVKNKHAVETVSVTVNKYWDHTNNDGEKPGSVVFHISNNNGHMGESYKKTVTADDNWTAVWTGLPKYVNGVLQNYVVWEEDVENYTGRYTLVKDDDGNRIISITNTYDPDFTTVSVRKHWNDGNDQDGMRPVSLTVTLQKSADGVNWSDEATVTLTATAVEEGTGSWAYVWSSLPTKENGTAVEYRVVEKAEDVPAGYTMVSTVEDSDVEGLWHITNKHVPETTSITVNKVWKNTYENFRPESVTVALLADGKATGKTAVIEKSEGWTYTFTDLDVYKNGKKIVYSVKETPVDGFTSVVSEIDDNGVITVTNTLNTVSIEATKVWLDEDGKVMDWPEGVSELTFYLHANGERLYEYYAASDPERAATYVKTLTKAQWDAGVTGVAWTGLASVFGNTSVAYTVWEKVVEEYAVDYELVSENDNGDRVVEIINRFDPEHTEIAVSKTWEDAYDQDGIRPEVIEVKLYADVGGVKTLKDTAYLAQSAGAYSYEGGNVAVTTGSWIHIWTELPIHDDDGNEISYTVEETAVDGYDPEKTTYVYDEAEKLWHITNYHTPETVEITVNKEWETYGNDVELPSVEISLLSDGEVIRKIELGSDDNWAYTFEDLPKYKVIDGVGGQLIEYRVIETPVIGYDAPVYSTDEDGNVTVTNTLDTVYLNVRKVWDDVDDYDGLRPSEITVKLLANGKPVDGKTVEIGADHNWWYRFADLPKYDADGKIIEYTVEEVPVENYDEPEYGYNTAGTYVAITNTHVPLMTEVTVTKEWDDQEDRDQARPETVMVQLYKDGRVYDQEPYNKPIELSEANGWSYKFTDLYRYDGYGELFVYEIKEFDVENYEMTSYVSSSAEDYASHEITIINTYVPAKEITVTKKWDDDNNRDNIRPESVTVHLLADGEKIHTAVLSDENDWTATYSQLYTWNSNGEEIVYTVEEDTIEGYEPGITGNADDGFVITNKHTPKTTNITIEKVWKDNDNKEGKRPQSITVQLYANGEKYGDPVAIKADEDGKWSYTYEELYVNENGKAITYTVKEAGVKYYVAKYSDLVDGTITIKNTFVDIPLTGDTMNMIFWSVMVIGAGAALSVIGTMSFRKRRFGK